jgi:hypothetical protein
MTARWNLAAREMGLGFPRHDLFHPHPKHHHMLPTGHIVQPVSHEVHPVVHSIHSHRPIQHQALVARFDNSCMSDKSIRLV